MRASSNNHYQNSLPFTDIKIHSNKFSEDDTGYDSLPKQQRIDSIACLSSSSSSSNNQFYRIMNLVKSIPSPTDISTTYNPSEIALSVAQRVAQYSKKAELTTTPIRKLHRTRIQPIPDSTSDSADSIAVSNRVVLVSSYRQENISPFGGKLEYIHNNRFDSTTTVDHIKNDIIAIELTEKEQQQSKPLMNSFSSRIKRLGESIRLLPANVLAIVFISLIGGLIVSAIFIIIIY
jgi:hypothetical protein